MSESPPPRRSRRRKWVITLAVMLVVTPPAVWLVQAVQRVRIAAGRTADS